MADSGGLRPTEARGKNLAEARKSRDYGVHSDDPFGLSQCWPLALNNDSFLISFLTFQSSVLF